MAGVKLAAVVLACLVLTGCGSSDPVPDVDWSKVPDFQRDMVNEAIKEHDCNDMDGLAAETKRPDLRAYLAWQMRHNYC